MLKTGIISLTIVLSAIFFSSVASAYDNEITRISKEMADAIEPSGEGQTALANTIAVVDFTDLQGNVTELGRFLAEEFSVKLATSGKSFEVVDRTHLKSIIKEHKLSETGIIDSATARKLGSIAGVEALVTGTMTPFGDTIRLSAKILDTETAKIITAQTMNIPKTGALTELVNRSIEEVQQKTYQARTVAAVSNAPPPVPEAMQTKEIEGFAFYLQSCVRSDKTLKFGFLVESKEKDQNIAVHVRGTRFFDNFGNEYGPSQINISNKGIHYGKTSSLLVAKIPTKMVITFKDINPKAVSVPLLEVNCGKFKFQMRNIPIND